MMTESDLQEIRQKQKRRNQILFSKESDCLRVLFDALASAPRRTVTCWAFACAEPIKDELAARYPLDPRPAEVFVLSKAWAQGEIKMPIAKRAILAVHAMAKDMCGCCTVSCTGTSLLGGTHAASCTGTADL